MRSKLSLWFCFTSLLVVLAFTSRPAFAQRGADSITDRVTIAPALTITGRITYENCSPANPVSFLVRGPQSRQVTARMTPIGGEFATEWNYVINLPSLQYGTYTVTPRLSPGDCPGGSWSPASRTVPYSVSVQSARGLDFHYGVPLTRTRIPLALLTSLMEGCLRGTQIHLNNHGPRHGDSWLVANDSFLRLSGCLGGEETRFTLPEHVEDGRLRPRVRMLYYINDLNLQGIDVGTEGRSFKLTLQFDDAGTELKGHCIKRELIGNGWKDCPVGTDQGAPDIQIQRARVHVFLEPSAYLGGISFGRVQAQFEGTIQAGGGCDVLGIDLCEKLAHYKREVRQQIEQAFTTLINRGSTHSAVARTFREILDARGIGEVRSASIEGGQLIIISSPVE